MEEVEEEGEDGEEEEEHAPAHGLYSGGDGFRSGGGCGGQAVIY